MHLRVHMYIHVRLLRLAAKQMVLKHQHVSTATTKLQRFNAGVSATAYLLRYLRTAKFSQLRAREIIEGNLKLRTELPHWYHNHDPLDDDQMLAIKLG